MHILEGGLGGVFESDPSRPDFRRIVSPSRKFTGDNADAIYHDAPISGDREYVVRGNMDGAVYIAITLVVEGAERDAIAGLLRVSGFAPDGLFFELGLRPGAALLARYRSGDITIRR